MWDAVSEELARHLRKGSEVIHTTLLIWRVVKCKSCGDLHRPTWIALFFHDEDLWPTQQKMEINVCMCVRCDLLSYFIYSSSLFCDLADDVLYTCSMYSNF